MVHQLLATYYWLVVWNMNFIFPLYIYIYGILFPNDFHIFQDGLKPPSLLEFCP